MVFFCLFLSCLHAKIKLFTCQIQTVYMLNSNVVTHLFDQFKHRHRRIARILQIKTMHPLSISRNSFAASEKFNTEQIVQPRHAWNLLSCSNSTWTINCLQPFRSATKYWKRPQESMSSHFMDVQNATVTSTGRTRNEVSVLVAALDDTRWTENLKRYLVICLLYFFFWSFYIVSLIHMCFLTEGFLLSLKTSVVQAFEDRCLPAKFEAWVRETS